jgi:DsbC/DsbD-like thiol-disulfide interchange protein
MSRYVFVVIFAIALLFCVYEASAQQEVPTPVKASLVSDVNAIVPGESFKLGVLFEIIPHWHIYWKNSGDTGLPTKVIIKLPEGFTTEYLNWPIPKAFTRAGDITDYGYEDSLLLYTQVNVPEGLKPGSEILISAEVSWVSCEEICIPGRVGLKLKLSVSNKAQDMNTDLFSEWESVMPLTSSDENSPFKIDISSTGKNETSEIINISLEYDNPVSGIGLYPVPGDTLSVRNITIDNLEEEGKTDIKLEVRPLSGGDIKDSNLETLIVYNDKDGKRSGVVLAIPLED